METRKTFKQLAGIDFYSQIYVSKEFHKIKDEIEKWKDTNSGINSNFANGIVDAILRLCVEIREYTSDFFTSKTNAEFLPEDHPYHSENISWNYSQPIQTGINQWSVFVRKYKGMKQCVGVIEHRFYNEEDASIFSSNNWNLGDYF
jgi:hypothetical protein